MAERAYAPLGTQLLRAGMSPSRVRRTVNELEDHFVALVDEQVKRGVAPDDAVVAARQRLGTDEDLLTGMLAHAEFRSWGARWPWVCALVPGGLLLVAELAVFSSMPIALFIVHWFDQSPASVLAPGSSVAFLDLVVIYREILLYGLPLLVAGLLGVYAARRRLQLLWPLIGIAATTALGALISFTVQAPIPGVRLGRIGAALTFNPNLHGLERFGLRWTLVALVPAFLYVIWQWRSEIPN